MEIWGGNQAADTSISTPGLDFWVYSRPHQEADGGGDVHYLSLCGGGVITRILLADISGHGASVADMAKSLRDLMRRNINRKDQQRLVQELNKQFADLARMSRFATAVVATYLTKGDKFTVSNAGHPRPLWYRATTGEWSVFQSAEEPTDRPADLPLGIDETTAYTEREITLGKGDLVLFYTDALIEATGADGTQLGEAGLLELLRFLNPTEPAALATSLVERLEQHRDSKPAEDDLTFLLLHHNAAPAPRLSLRETFAVYARLLGLKPV
jgi:serine phosphatase RsbU (regulator of sigma subunit)